MGFLALIKNKWTEVLADAAQKKAVVKAERQAYYEARIRNASKFAEAKVEKEIEAEKKRGVEKKVGTSNPEKRESIMSEYDRLMRGVI